MKMRMAKMSHLVEVTDRCHGILTSMFESLQNQANDMFSVVNCNIRNYYEIPDGGDLDVAYSPKRLPYTIAHYRNQFMKRGLRNKRKHIKGVTL